MLFPWISLNRMHWCIEQCKKVAERKRRRVVAEEEQTVTSRAFSAYGHPLEMVASFQYLGQVILAADDNWLEVVRNLSRVRTVWKRMTVISSREGVEPRVSRFFL